MKARNTVTALAIAAAAVTGTLALTAQGNDNRAALAAADGTKVATVDIVKLLDALDEKGDVEGRLQKTLEARKDELNKVVDQIKGINADIDTLKPGTDQYREKLRERYELNTLLKARQDAMQQIISIERGQTIRDIYVKINAAVKKIAERDGFDIVLFDPSGQPIPDGEVTEPAISDLILNRDILYSGPSVQITDRVATLMNNEYRAGKP